MRRLLLAALCAALAGCVDSSAASEARDGSAAQPLRVMLIPADGGTEAGTRADFEPIFNAVGAANGLHFELRVGQSYNAVVQAMANRQVEIAFFGPVSYCQARKLGAAELLAVAERDGSSTYHAAIFVRGDSAAKALTDLRGKSIAFGDVNSTSSFVYQVAMLLAAKVDPVKDLGKLFMTGSHANALQALAGGKVDAACASLDSYEKAVEAGKLDPKEVRVLQKSDPIPYPPLAIHPALQPALKEKLKAAFHGIHQQKGIKPEMLRGYGGKQVDRYNARFPQAEFDAVTERLASVSKTLKEEMLRKAGER